MKNPFKDPTENTMQIVVCAIFFVLGMVFTLILRKYE